ncbi:MAG: hypothetical protein PHW52_01110 [Candidatus Pacebacteria bacterium]|nr:hypothetical protein [Candidatus Paceibacterota bacterium]
MRKKIYDIVPPKEIGRQEVREEESEEVEIEVKDEPFKKQKFKQPRKPLGKGFLFSIILLALAGCLVAFYYFTDTKTDINIYPKVENLQAERNATIALSDDYQAEEGADRFVISGKVLTEEQSYDDQIKATGSADGEGFAKGKIKITASHTPETALPLLKGTRFLSDKNGKIYRIQSAISVPAGSDGKPGIIEVEVVADQPGEDYNIDSSTFTVPGFKEQNSPYYETTKAETVTAISGGSKGVGVAVSESDINGAKEKFKQQQFEGVKNRLMMNISDEYMVLDKTVSQEVTDFKVKAKAGDKVDSFDISGTIKTKMIVIKKQDLDSLLKSMASVEEDGNFGYVIKDMNVSDLSEKDNHYEMKLSVVADYYSLGSNDSIISQIAMKSKEEANAVLVKDGKVEKADIDIKPGWKNQISSNKENINIKIEALAK